MRPVRCPVSVRMKQTMRSAASIRRQFWATPHIHRAVLLLDGYQPAEKMTLARMIKAIRIAKTLGRELEPEPLVRRLPQG